MNDKIIYAVDNSDYQDTIKSISEKTAMENDPLVKLLEEELKKEIDKEIIRTICGNIR